MGCTKTVNTMAIKKIEDFLSAARLMGQQMFDEHPAFKGKKFTLDPGTEIFEYYTTLGFYFLNDPEFEKRGEGYNLHKGLFVLGNFGNGKTMAFNVIKKMITNSSFRMEIISCNKFVTRYATQGEDLIDEYSNRSFFTKFTNGNEIFNRLEPFHILFDDLGRENIANNFGNKVIPMKAMIMERYDLWMQYYAKTFFTSNITREEIIAKYDEAVMDRLEQMCNLIKVEGLSLRV